MKCLKCVTLAQYDKMKWSDVEEAICTYSGCSYCYAHLFDTIGWSEEGKR